MSDRPKDVEFVICHVEKEIAARGIEPHAGSIVDYCKQCKRGCRVSPKSQRWMKQREGSYVICRACYDVIVAGMDPSSIVTCEFTTEEDYNDWMKTHAKHGHTPLFAIRGKPSPCTECAMGNHDNCDGGACGCTPCSSASMGGIG